MNDLKDLFSPSSGDKSDAVQRTHPWEFSEVASEQTVAYLREILEDNASGPFARRSVSYQIW
jgi:hypothetical protein